MPIEFKRPDGPRAGLDQPVRTDDSDHVRADRTPLYPERGGDGSPARDWSFAGDEAMPFTPRPGVHDLLKTHEFHHDWFFG